MGQPNCTWCGEKIDDRAAMIQVVSYPINMTDDDEMEVIAEYHRECWDAKERE